jgi:hypothetical protein
MQLAEERLSSANPRARIKTIPEDDLGNRGSIGLGNRGGIGANLGRKATAKRRIHARE